MNGMEIQAIHIEGSKVEILAFCEMKLLNQKISRLKSKTSSALLSSKYTEEFFGRRIWGKSFWYSTILHKENLAISIIKT